MISASVANTQETRRLLERLGADTRNFQHLHARAEASILVAIVHDVERRALGDAGHVAQQRPRRCVQIHADPVDAALHDVLERLGQFALIHIVLVLPDADGLGVDLHQLGKRILKPACNGNGAAHCEI